MAENASKIRFSVAIAVPLNANVRSVVVSCVEYVCPVAEKPTEPVWFETWALVNPWFWQVSRASAATLAAVVVVCV